MAPAAGRSRGGAGPAEHVNLYQAATRGVLSPDTPRARAAAPDTTRAQAPAVALQPDADEKVTRRSALYIVAAIAVLTLTTLLLYNVRSR
jgi:hypothetical protein